MILPFYSGTSYPTSEELSALPQSPTFSSLPLPQFGFAQPLMMAWTAEMDDVGPLRSAHEPDPFVHLPSKTRGYEVGGELLKDLLQWAKTISVLWIYLAHARSVLCRSLARGRTGDARSYIFQAGPAR